MVNRIRELLDIRQLSPTQFADLIGVGRPVISHILSERNKPSLEVVQKVISAFPDISLPWLLSGTGPMLAVTTSAGAPPVAPLSASLPVATPGSTVPSSPTEAPVLPSPVQPFPAAPVPALVAPVPVAMSEPPAVAPVLPVAATSPAAQATRLPQPPKFRLGVKPTPLPESISSPVVTTAIAETPVPVAAAPLPPTPAPEPIAMASFNAPFGQPVVTPVPVPAFPELSAGPALLHAAGMEASLPTSATVPPTTPAVPAATFPVPSPNSAAAFSFLGDAGKTVRRIVLFYSDGSFSDYRPEA